MLHHALAISFSAELSRLKAAIAPHAKLKTSAATQKEAARYHQPPSSTCSLSAKCRCQLASISAQETDTLGAWGPLAGAQVVVIGLCLGVKKQKMFSSSAPLVFQHGQVCKVERDSDPTTPHALVVYVARQPQVSAEDADKRPRTGGGGCMSCFMSRSRKPEPRDLENQSGGRKVSPREQGMQGIEVLVTPDQVNSNQGSQNLVTNDEGERKKPYLALRVVFSGMDELAKAEAALVPLMQYDIYIYIYIYIYIGFPPNFFILLFYRNTLGVTPPTPFLFYFLFTF